MCCSTTRLRESSMCSIKDKGTEFVQTRWGEIKRTSKLDISVNEINILLVRFSGIMYHSSTYGLLSYSLCCSYTYALAYKTHTMAHTIHWIETGPLLPLLQRAPVRQDIQFYRHKQESSSTRREMQITKRFSPFGQ